MAAGQGIDLDVARESLLGAHVRRATRPARFGLALRHDRKIRARRWATYYGQWLCLLPRNWRRYPRSIDRNGLARRRIIHRCAQTRRRIPDVRARIVEAGALLTAEAQADNSVRRLDDEFKTTPPPHITKSEALRNIAGPLNPAEDKGLDR